MRKMISAAFLLVATAGMWAQDASVYQTIDAVILVPDTDRAAGDLAKWVDDAGGYVLRRSTDTNVYRVPSGKLPEFRAFLERTASDMVRYTPSAQDLQEALLGLESGIRSREEIFGRNLTYLARAGVKDTLAIEKVVMSLLVEIETMKGKLRKLDVDRRFALVSVSLGMVKEQIPTNIPTSFVWLNQLDFFGFVGGTSSR